MLDPPRLWVVDFGGSELTKILARDGNEEVHPFSWGKKLLDQLEVRGQDRMASDAVGSAARWAWGNPTEGRTVFGNKRIPTEPDCQQ